MNQRLLEANSGRVTDRGKEGYRKPRPITPVGEEAVRAAAGDDRGASGVRLVWDDSLQGRHGPSGFGTAVRGPACTVVWDPWLADVTQSVTGTRLCRFSFPAIPLPYHKHKEDYGRKLKQ